MKSFIMKLNCLYIAGALAAMLDLGKGSGPMDHGFAITGEYKKESERE